MGRLRLAVSGGRRTADSEGIETRLPFSITVRRPLSAIHLNVQVSQNRQTTPNDGVIRK
jgi:hypothetical protein